MVRASARERQLYISYLDLMPKIHIHQYIGPYISADQLLSMDLHRHGCMYGQTDRGHSDPWFGGGERIIFLLCKTLLQISAI